MPARFEHLERFVQLIAAQAVEHHVVVTQDGGKVLLLVVDYDVRAQGLHPGDVGRTGGRGHERTEMLGQLDGNAADAARTGLDQHLLALLQLRGLHQCLPCSQRHQRK